MDLTGKTLWQVGAGDTDRSYGDICIKYDVMLAGPGKLENTRRHAMRTLATSEDSVEKPSVVTSFSSGSELETFLLLVRLLMIKRNGLKLLLTWMVGTCSTSGA